jgi:predicted ABC-type ATPase
MRKAKLRGFHVDLIYLCLNTPEHGILRVQERVGQGGHNVPDEDIRRRYFRSLDNLPEAIRIADRAILFDNSRYTRRCMLETRSGLIVWSASKRPVWVAAVMAAL